MGVVWSGAGTGAAGSGTTFLVVLVAVAVGGWLVSLALHPQRRCPRCGGTGRFYGSVFPGTFRLCSRCGGTGRQPRAGAALFRR